MGLSATTNIQDNVLCIFPTLMFWEAKDTILVQMLILTNPVLMRVKIES